jgi:hypothetical protein
LRGFPPVASNTASEVLKPFWGWSTSSMRRRSSASDRFRRSFWVWIAEASASDSEANVFS